MCACRPELSTFIDNLLVKAKPVITAITELTEKAREASTAVAQEKAVNQVQRLLEMLSQRVSAVRGALKKVSSTALECGRT